MAEPRPDSAFGVLSARVRLARRALVSEWLWWVFGSLCWVLAALQIIGGCWVLIEWHRKWRPVRELWSIDWLDIVYRLERDFGVTFTAGDFEGWSAETRVALTAGQLWEMVAAKLRDAGTESPPDGWERVVAVLSDALNVKPRQVTPASRLYADLGMV
jgi:hypothetical protein